MVAALCSSAIAADDSYVTYDENGQPILHITIYGFRTPTDLSYKTYTSHIAYLAPGDGLKQSVATTSGVDLVQSGPKGQTSSLFLRGADSNHTLLAFNGISIRDESTTSGADDVTQHSTVGIESVEVIKGPAGALYGANAVAGVVNMNSVVNTNNYVQGTIGSNNTFNERIKLGKRVGDTALSFEAENETSSGISVHAGGAEKDPYRSQNYSLAQETYLDNGYTFYAGYIQNHNKANLDSSSADVLNYTSDWKWRNFNTALSNDRTRLVYNHSIHDREYNNSGSIDKYGSTTDTFLGTHRFSLSDNFDSTVGYEYTHSRGTMNTTIGGWEANVDQTRTNNALLLNNVYKFTKDKLINFSIRQDENSNFASHTSGRIGGYYNGFKASVATGFRVPTFYELYGVDNFGFTGNPNLKAETSRSYEIGYGNSWFDITYFDISTKDAVTYSYNPSTWTATYTNDSGESKSTGVEFALHHSIGNWDFRNDFTYTDAKTSTGAAKLRRPKVKNVTSVGYRLDDLTKLGAAVRYTGAYQDLNGATYAQFETSSITVVDLYATKVIDKSWTAFARLNNLTDLKYQQPSGYAQPGRSIFVGAKYSF